MINQRDIVEELVRKKKFDFYLYEYPVFELRIKEEIVRTDLFGSPFIYMEILFTDMFTESAGVVEITNVWECVLELLSQVVRGSDVKGFIRDDSGVGLLLLDSDKVVVQNLRTKLIEHLKHMGLDVYLKDSTDATFIDGFLYPATGGKPH
jgi:hypothetical protein